MSEPRELTESQSVTEKEKSINQLDVMEKFNTTKELDAPWLDDNSFERELAELLQAKDRAADVPIPIELDNYIQKGLAKGVKAQKAWRFRKWGTFVACFLIVAFIMTARVSPAVAAVLQQIPGLGYIVELIYYDKGLQSAVENDFIQPLGVSDVHENVMFTVDGIIMDEASLVIFYTVENKRGEGTIDFSEVKIFDEKGQALKEVTISHSSLGDPDQDGDRKIQSQINVNFYDHTLIPDRLLLKIKLREIMQEVPPELFTHLASTWEVTIPVDKDRFTGMKTVYEVNQSVFIEGQKITFEKVTVYPTRMILNVMFDPENNKKIFAFDDLTLVNEKGEEWGRILNGVTGSLPGENQQSIFFQSNYFTQPKKLYLRGKSIRALDKEDLRVTVDLDRGRIIEGPPNLVLDQIKVPSVKETELVFSLKTNPEYEKHGFSIFSSEFTDARGKPFAIGKQGISLYSDNHRYDQTLMFTLPGRQSFLSPITFQIQDFPSRIMDEFNIRIK